MGLCLTFKPTGTLNVMVLAVTRGHACAVALGVFLLFFCVCVFCASGDWRIMLWSEGVFGCCRLRAADSHPADP